MPWHDVINYMPPTAKHTSTSLRLRMALMFPINGSRYTGPWDESSLADAMLAPLGHRIQSTAFRFVRWRSSAGLLLGMGGHY